jgi:hypothetical protein
MRDRVVVPEILDHLPAWDPEAVRSRTDLRRINFLMGNESWICKAILRFREQVKRGVVEIGAGNGELIHRLARMFPDSAVSAHDLSPAPKTRGSRVVWHQGDLFQTVPPTGGGVLVANLFVHHFEGAQLALLGRWMRAFEVIIINEPDRSGFPLVLGGIMHPFINRVTRHDMHVSIRAGFRQGELQEWLGLGPESWQVIESSTWRGARRVVASRT